VRIAARFIAQVGLPVPLDRKGPVRGILQHRLLSGFRRHPYLAGCAINVDGGRSPVV
jgi:hypothetical protein